MIKQYFYFIINIMYVVYMHYDLMNHNNFSKFSYHNVIKSVNIVGSCISIIQYQVMQTDVQNLQKQKAFRLFGNCPRKLLKL